MASGAIIIVDMLCNHKFIGDLFLPDALHLCNHSMYQYFFVMVADNLFHIN